MSAELQSTLNNTPATDEVDMPAAAPSQQYLTVFMIIRKDLSKAPLNWPTGAVIGNAAHAATAVLHKYCHEERTIKYLEDMESMRKVVLETKNEGSLLKVAEQMKEKGILHHLWIETPEGIPACLATAPYIRDDVNPFLKKCQLYRS